MAKTTKDVIGDGYTTHGSNGTTYRTSKNVLGDGHTTHGDDGSTYRHNKNAFGKGYTTYQTRKPDSSSSKGMGGDVGGSIALFVVGIFLVLSCASVLTPIAYVFAVIAIVSPMLAGLLERVNVSRLWSSGVLFTWSSFQLIGIVFQNARDTAGHDSTASLFTIIALAVFLILGLYFAIYGLGEEGWGFWAFFFMFVSLPVAFFGGLGGESAIADMLQYVQMIPNTLLRDLLVNWQTAVVVILAVIASIHQVSLLVKASK